MDPRKILTAQCCGVNVLSSGDISQQACPRNRDKCSPYCKSAEMLMCGVYYALQIAQYAVKERHSVDTEMCDFRVAFIGSDTGGVFFPTEQGYEVIRDTTLMFQKIAETAKKIIGDYEPVTSSRTFGDLVDLCSERTPAGIVIDTRAMDALEGSCGTNKSGRGCDVTRGPCSCGAWH